MVVLDAAHSFLGRGSWCKQRDEVDEDAILHVGAIVCSTGKGKVGPDKEVHVLVQFAVVAQWMVNPRASANGGTNAGLNNGMDEAFIQDPPVEDGGLRCRFEHPRSWTNDPSVALARYQRPQIFQKGQWKVS